MNVRPHLDYCPYRVSGRTGWMPCSWPLHCFWDWICYLFFSLHSSLSAVQGRGSSSHLNTPALTLPTYFLQVYILSKEKSVTWLVRNSATQWAMFYGQAGPLCIQSPDHVWFPLSCFQSPMSLPSQTSPMSLLEQELANFFCSGSDNRQHGLGKPHSLCSNYPHSTPLL